jgi:hypothetical protein
MAAINDLLRQSIRTGRSCQENFAKSIYAVSLPVASWQNVVASVPSGIGAPC